MFCLQRRKRRWRNNCNGGKRRNSVFGPIGPKRFAKIIRLIVNETIWIDLVTLRSRQCLIPERDAKDTLEKHLCKDSIIKSGFINLSSQGKVYKTSLYNTVNIQCVQKCKRPKLKTLDSLGLPRTHWKSQCVTNRKSDGFRMNHCKYIQTLPYFKKLYTGIIF